MKPMRSIAVSSALALTLTAFVAGSASAAVTETAEAHEFVVLFAEGSSSAAQKAAVAAAGGSIESENTDVGVATVTSNDASFAAKAAAQTAIVGSMQNRVIGAVPDDTVGEKGRSDSVENEARLATATAAAKAAAENAAKAAKSSRKPTAEPLADLQWDMKQIGATADGSYKYETGSKKVKVGIIDTGVDGTHPDIAPNFDTKLSRNFTVDIPYDANGDVIDGPCSDEPDKSCNDPANVDEDGHGTHVASTVGSPINGIGMAGVAPNVDIVNLRAGQDSGYFFLKPSLDALTYAARNGIDVVNMSYYVDPWLFNCTNNPADSPEDQQEQKTVITAMQRALDFARLRGVTLVSAAGNGASDYTKPMVDASSPDFASVPGEVAYTRDLLDPASCVSMPSEGKGVISVSSTGPSKRKAYYSDYGNGYIDVAAPGGDAYDTADNRLNYGGLVLAAYPQALAEANGEIDANGEPTVPYVVKSCDAAGTTCGYYQYLQGTSMASPHAVGVAALIVSRFGLPDLKGGKWLPPSVVEKVLETSATATACPSPAAFTYTIVRASGTTTDTHTCEGSKSKNGFYGNGIINAMRAIGH